VLPTGRIARLIVGSVVLSAICAAGILIGTYPYRPNTATAWAGLFLLGPPIMLFGEAIGERVLENRFVAKMSQGVRMTYAVVLGCLLIAGLVIFTKSDLFNSHFARWGS
jgi:hypothetical protein